MGKMSRSICLAIGQTKKSLNLAKTVVSPSPQPLSPREVRV